MGAKNKARDLAKNVFQLKAKDKATFYFPTEAWVMLAPSLNNSEEREFVAYSRASMHMLSKKDSRSGELEILRRSKIPTTVVTANVECKRTRKHKKTFTI